MGGNALKNLKEPTRRCSRKEFDEYSTELVDTLKLTFSLVGIPRFYKNKESFGDIDIIICAENFNGNIRDYIETNFHPNEIFHNGECWSFDYNNVQIDLITASLKDFHSSLHYMSDNDCGNYIGKIAHGFGFKYGQSGLVYDHYFKGSNIGRVLISKDYPKIYEFLGLSYERWEEGFDELEDIFKYVSESKYFNWEYLQFENNNRINRERDAKRKSYTGFLDYIDANCKDDNHRYRYEKDKSVYVDKADEFFPEANLKMEIRRMEYEHCKALYIKAKFNGGDVMRKYGLKDKALGDALNSFKKAVGNIFKDESYDDYILRNSVEQIYSDFETWIKPN